jgi:PAS domain S-box-containing protein
VAVDPAGDIWVGTGRGLYHYGPKFDRKEILFPADQTNVLLVDRHDRLWIGTNEHGVGRYENGAFRFLQKNDGLGNDNVKALFEDAEGNLWIATLGGLSQLTDVKFPIFSSKEGLVAGSATGVAASHRGGLWISTSTGASYFDGHTAANYTDPSLLPNNYTRRIWEAANGDVYLCDGSKNITVVSNGKLVTRYTNALWPEAFTEDAESVIAGIGPNLVRLIDGKIEPYVFNGEKPAFDWINNLYLTKENVLWAATNNGLFRIENGQFRHWSMVDGLSSNRIHFVLEDSDKSLWLGLPTGLIRFKQEHFTQITYEDGLADSRIYSIVPDDRGFFWMASGRGILRVARQNLTDFADRKISRIDCVAFDGLESVKFTDRTDQGFSACKTADGRIWFPNPRGVVMIDPARYFTNQVPPRVYVQKINVNGVDQPPGQMASLDPRQRNVDFFFTALSFIAPKKIQVRYQLEGYDPAWVDAGVHRSASYRNLQPGNYRFRVQAANVDGVWNTDGDTYSIDLPPPFHRTFWFYGLCVLAGALLLMAVYWLKVRRMHAVQKKLQSENDRLEESVRRRTDELASSLSLLQATLDSTGDGILAIQFSGAIASHNRQFGEMWSIPPESMRHANDRTVRDLCAAQVKDPAQFLKRIDEIHDSNQTEAFDVIELKDGRIFERYCRPQRLDGQCVGVVINFRDITGRKRAEATIAEASALLESLLANTLDVIYFKDCNSRLVRYSDSILPLYGATDRDGLKGKSDFDLFPEERARAYFEEEQEIIRTGTPQIDKLERAVNAAGEPTWNMVTKLPWKDINGRIIGTFGVARDVTALKETESRLAYERDLLRALMDSSPDQIYFKDRKSRFIRCSQAQANNCHVSSSAEIIGRTDFDFFAEEHARRAFEDEQEIIRSGKPLIGKVEKEVWRDGRTGWVLTSKMPLRNNTGEIIGTIGISKDITELKLAEAKLAEVHRQLLETSRQAGMAEVATSVLHNVGNVLNSVNVSATLVSDQIRDSKATFVPKVGALLQANSTRLAEFFTTDPKGRKLPSYLATLGDELLSEQATITTELGHLRKNIEHIKEIVSMQQSFAKVSGVSETVPLAELIDDAVRINASALTRHQVELIRDYQVRPEISIERHKLMQILVNLIRNAKYACDDSGREDKQMIIRTSQHGDRIQIQVIDNGVGIPAENLTRIFAHGFTTRKEGHGFGLHSGALVAKELGGSLVAQSRGPGLGATFTIDLPLNGA